MPIKDENIEKRTTQLQTLKSQVNSNHHIKHLRKAYINTYIRRDVKRVISPARSRKTLIIQLRSNCNKTLTW